MRIRYENTKADSIAFRTYWVAHSPLIKQRIVRNRLSRTLLAALIFYLCTFGVSVGYRVVVAVIGAVVMYFALEGSIRRSIKKQIEQDVEKNAGKSILCEHILEITPEGIVERNPYTENKVSWAGIEKIESTPEHTFLYVSPNAAHIIPHNAILEGDVRAFLLELGARYDPNKTLAPLAPLVG